MRDSQLKKGNIVAYLIAIFVVIAVMFMLKQCSSERPLAATAEAASGGDTIDVAIDYSPMSLYTFGDTLGGFGYDLLRIIAADNGLTLKFHPITRLERAIELLDSGRYDLIVADLPSTIDYKKLYLFTDPVFLDRSVLVQRLDSAGGRAVAGQLDLAGRTVTVVAGSPTADRVANLGREIGDTIYIVRDSVYGAEQLVMLVATGDVALAVVNEGVARTVARDYPRLDVTTAISFSQFQAWMTTKDKAPLRDSLNAMIGRALATDAYRALAARYGVTAPARPLN